MVRVGNDTLKYDFIFVTLIVRVVNDTLKCSLLFR